MQQFNQLVQQAALIQDLANATREGKLTWHHIMSPNVAWRNPRPEITWPVAGAILSAKRGELDLRIGRYVAQGKVWFVLEISTPNKDETLCLSFTDDLHSHIYTHLQTLQQSASRSAAVLGPLQLLEAAARGTPAVPA